MATVTTNMLDPSRLEAADTYALAILTDISTFFESDYQTILEEVNGDDSPIETVTSTKITLDFQMGSRFVIEGTGLTNLANGTLNPYTITHINFTSANGIVLDLTGSVTVNPGTGAATGSLTSLDITSSWFTANIDISAINITEFTGSVTFSSIDITVPSMLDGGTAIQVKLTGTMTADDLGLSGTVNTLTVISGSNSFTATGLNGDLAVLANATSPYEILTTLLAGADTINGTNGNDHLSGFSGNDTLNGSLGRDKILGGDGNDVHNGGDGQDSLWSGLGNDTLNGGNGNDDLRDSSGTNKLYGNAGNDTLVGGTGADTLDGGTETDTLSYAYVGSADATGVTVNLTNTTTAQNTVRAGNDLVKDIENLIGSNYKDILTGNTLANLLKGGNGADKLVGNAGNDKLYGEAGNDTLQGGDGNDVIFGGDGKDSMTGGGSSDTFYFDEEFDSVVATPDIITDFVHGVDKINLRQMPNDNYDKPFVFESGAGFVDFSGKGAGALYYDTTADILYGNTNWDNAADFAIKFTNNVALTASDIVL